MQKTTDHEWQSCLRKNRYETYMEALMQANAANARTGHGNILAYECDYGDHYHIGHPPKPSHHRCDVCGDNIKFDDFNEHQYREHGII